MKLQSSINQFSRRKRGRPRTKKNKSDGHFQFKKKISEKKMRGVKTFVTTTNTTTTSDNVITNTVTTMTSSDRDSNNDYSETSTDEEDDEFEHEGSDFISHESKIDNFPYTWDKPTMWPSLKLAIMKSRNALMSREMEEEILEGTKKQIVPRSTLYDALQRVGLKEVTLMNCFPLKKKNLLDREKHNS